VLVSVVCPFFNEEALIATTVEGCIQRLRGDFTDWELVLVNDGSTDRSLELLLSKLDQIGEPRVRVLSYPRNRGRGRALKTGIESARGEIVVTTEVDGSWGGDIVKRLAARLDDDPSLGFVVASPHMTGGGFGNVPMSRVLLTRWGNRFLKFFMATGFSMQTGMTRGYRREVIQPLSTFEDGKEFHLEVLLKLLLLGFKGAEIPATLTWPAHKTGQPKRKSSTRIWRTALSHLKYVFFGNPHHYFVFAALVAAILATLFFVGAVVNLLTGGVAAFYAIVSGLLGLGAFLLLGFAAIFSQFKEAYRLQVAAAYRRDVLAVAEVTTAFPRQSTR